MPFIIVSPHDIIKAILHNRRNFIEVKENRNGIIFCLVIALICLALSITFSYFKTSCNWGLNFSFAILGSALLSLLICTINYITFRKKLIEELLVGLYVYNNDTNTQLYLFNEKKDVGSLAMAIGVASAHITKLSYLAYSIEAGLCCFERKKRSITKKIIETIEQETHFRIYSLGQFLQNEKEKAQQEKDYIYKQIEKVLQDEKVYNLAFDLAKHVNSVVKKMEEAFNMPKEKIKDLMCEFVEAEILKMKMEENPNNTTVDEKK